MGSYWDLSEKERAALTEEQLEAFVPFELMQLGVERAVAPVDEAVPTMPVPTRMMLVPYKDAYGSSSLGVAFESLEHFQAFIALKPFVLTSEYSEGTYVNCTVPLPESVILKREPIHTQTEALAHAETIRNVQAIKNRNRERASEYQKAKKAENEALCAMRGDWLRCRDEAHTNEKIVATFAEYSELAKSPDLAAAFLRKRFSDEQIKAANDWTGAGIPASS